MLEKQNILQRILYYLSTPEEQRDAAEEAEADKVMKDTALKGLKKGIIKVRKKIKPK